MMLVLAPTNKVLHYLTLLVHMVCISPWIQGVGCMHACTNAYTLYVVLVVVPLLHHDVVFSNTTNMMLAPTHYLSLLVHMMIHTPMDTRGGMHVCMH